MIEIRNTEQNTELWIDNERWMLDSPEELAAIDKHTKTARGNCYVGGLGLGLVLKPLIENLLVTHIDVVEINKEVIEVVGPKFKHNKISIYHGDVSNLYPNPCYDWIYFDVWMVTPIEDIERYKKIASQYLTPDGVCEVWIG
jgi:spermidine synthase